MAMSWTSVLSICFLIGAISAAPAKTSAPPKYLVGNLEMLSRDIQEKCSKSQARECWGKPINKVHFPANCSQAAYESMFCEVDKALKVFRRVSCKGVVPNITIPNSLLENQGNCSYKSTQNHFLTLEAFCSDLNRTVEKMYRHC